jgi:transcriptional regulator with GAF, ATPase, and Fis domain
VNPPVVPQDAAQRDHRANYPSHVAYSPQDQPTIRVHSNPPMAKHHEAAFYLWQNRISALRCQAAMVHTGGNQREAARLIGLDHTTMFKILRRNDLMLLKRADAEGWKAPQ